MDIEEVVVTIKPDGRVEIQVRGVKGKECLELTRPLEELLGNKIELRKLTAEAYETRDGHIQVQQKKKRYGRNPHG